VATAWPAFVSYQGDEAWTWEHLALTRARALIGNADLASAFEDFRRGLLLAKGKGASVRQDVADMRARLLIHKPGSAWAAKSGPGRLMDIELMAQTCALLTGDPARRLDAQLRAGPKGGLLGRDQAEQLAQASRLFWRVQASARLLGLSEADPAALAEGPRNFVLRECGVTDGADLAARLTEASERSDRIITDFLAEGGVAGPGPDSPG